MKTQFYLFTSLLILISLVAQATVIRVNNQEDSDPEKDTYDNLQDAYNKAQANDTLQVEGSPEEYGSLTLEKPLVIIGPGYFLTENENIQAVEQAAVVQTFNFNAGSEGSIVIGLQFSRDNFSYPVVNVSNIEISRCYLYSPIRRPGSLIEDLNVNRCYFLNSAFWYNYNVLDKNLYFANNIVLGGFSIPEGTSGTIVNNVFAGDVFNVGTTSSLQIHNNVLLSTNEDQIVVPGLGSNISHNIASLKTFGTDNGNQADVLASQVFLQQGSTDGQWQIKADGPAAGAGREGIDIGAFGGPEPYVLSGVPAIPRITDLSTDGFINEDGELEITIQATTN